MTTARYLVGDVFDRLAEIPDGSVDLVMTSPPFYRLRSYLPDDHPDKAKEIGSEPTPAEYLDTMLALTVEWGRVLAPHGSICVELGDTYCGAGGYGSPDSPNPAYGDGDRFEERFEGRAAKRFKHKDDGWPEAKSLCFIPSLYAASLAYGRNLLRAPMTAREMLDYAEGWTLDNPDSSAIELLQMLRYWFDRYAVGTRGPVTEYEQWPCRNLVAWVRPNPPVGALGDKFRPATSYLTIACRARDRYFDLDAVRTPSVYDRATPVARATAPGKKPNTCLDTTNPAGAPPLDWWNHADLLIDDEIQRRAGKPTNNTAGYDRHGLRPQTGSRADDGAKMRHEGGSSLGAQGSHIRRRLEQAGYLGGPTDDVWDIAPTGYSGSHYAVFPKELCVRPILTMTPQRVCTTCGKPSRRIVGEVEYVNTRDGQPARLKPDGWRSSGGKLGGSMVNQSGGSGHDQNATRVAPTVGWSDCGHNTWRPGHVLDPFAGTGTTLAVATGHARAATGIDLDPRNAQLALERVGMFLTIDHGTRQETA